MSSIPAQVRAHILPCPTLSVTHFLQAILDAMHGDLPRESDRMFEEGPDGVVSHAEAEEVLIEEVDGVVVNATSSLAEEEGQGKRKRFRNQFYEQDALKYWDTK
jgi:hypothetical protein